MSVVDCNLNEQFWVRLTEFGLSSYLDYLNYYVPEKLKHTPASVRRSQVDGWTPIQGWKLIEWAGGSQEILSLLFTMNIRVTINQ